MLETKWLQVELKFFIEGRKIKPPDYYGGFGREDR
jgi:hypothetical protein